MIGNGQMREAESSVPLPRVSVIMNCFNSAEYLREALESVQSQSFVDWELIFWDNQSTDGSAEIFKSFDDPRFRYFRAEVHTKLGDARNRAVTKARGAWLAFLDCDDIWIKDKLQIQLGKAECTGANVGLIYSPVQFKFDTQRKGASSLELFYRRFETRPHDAMDMYRDLLQRNFIIFSTVVVSRKLYLDVGGINTTLTQNEDYDLLLKVARLSWAICVAPCCAIYRVHDSNISHSQAGLSYKENIQIYESLPQDPFVVRAQKTNWTRYAVYKIGQGEIYQGLKMLVTQGSALWAVKRAFSRLAARFLSD